MGCVQIFFCFSVVMIIICSVGFNSGKFLHFANEGDNKTTAYKPEEAYLSTHRKLKLHGICSNRDISISQSRYLTSGIPQYVVQIVNTCVFGCAPSNIHLHCGWFASARIVNPRSFKRVSYDDCLVNGGRPLKNSQIIRFTYANSFMYPLEFKTANFC
ncbi:TPD1 protein-like protein 1-like [Forsythia ovata]|uniref:TPD1 protein-like protein 1-like n=1 Tax=Forsythia ovata TaxID=205694 RepID=A0ABD1P7I1_9LAMI